MLFSYKIILLPASLQTPLPASNSLSWRQLFNKKRITYKCYHKSLNLLLPTALSIAQSYRARMLRDYQKLYRTLDASDAIPSTALLLCCHIIHHHRHLKCRLCVEWCDGMREKKKYFSFVVYACNFPAFEWGRDSSEQCIFLGRSSCRGRSSSSVG